MLTLALVLGAGCGDDDDGDSCVMRTTGIAGVAPDCMVWMECGEDAKWQLDCGGQSTGDGMCTCIENDEVVDTVEYEDDFCPPDYEGDMDVYTETASQACGGWPL